MTTATYYDFSIKLDSGRYTIEVDTAAQYGYFQNDETGTEGGLWFENNTLTDYDGTEVLPKTVATALRKACFVVGLEFD